MALTPDDLIAAAKTGGSILGFIVVLASALININPNRITALTARKEIEAKLARQKREDELAEKDKAEKRCSEMEAKADHWHSEALRIWELYVTEQDKCRADSIPCIRKPGLIQLRPFTPSIPAPIPAPPSPPTEKPT